MEASDPQLGFFAYSGVWELFLLAIGTLALTIGAFSLTIEIRVSEHLNRL